MDKLRTLLADAQRLLDELEAIDNQLEAESDPEKLQALQAQRDAKKAECEAKRAAIERRQERRRLAAGLSLPDAPVIPGQERAIGNPRPAWLEDPKRGFKTPREFFVAVMQATIRGETDDERLLYLRDKQATAGSDEAGTYAAPYGGFLVPAGFLPNLLSLAAEADPTAGRTTQIPMAAAKVSIPARTDKNHTTSVSGGLRVYRRSEAGTVDPSRMEFEQVELTATPLMGLSYATEELLVDSPISFAALIEAGFRTEYPAKILDEKLNGTGAGQMEGALKAPCLISITKETGQAADTIVYQNLIKMRARCWGYGNAIWLYNQDTLPQLMQLVIPVGVGGVPVWQGSAREGEPDTIFGRPAIETEYCPKLGDAGDILLGNWSQYLEGTYQPLESAESIHVRFIYNERTFRFTMRNDGRCWWRSALTPKKSGDTLSPFVVIAAR